MAGPEFFQTRMGVRFFEHDLPELTRQLSRLATALEVANHDRARETIEPINPFHMMRWMTVLALLGPSAPGTASKAQDAVRYLDTLTMGGVRELLAELYGLPINDAAMRMRQIIGGAP